MPYANHHVSTISCCLLATLALIVVCSIYAGQLFWAPKKIKRKAKMPLNLCIIFSVKGFFPIIAKYLYLLTIVLLSETTS